MPPGLAARTLAPLASSADTTSAWPPLAAAIRASYPSSVRLAGFAPRARSACTAGALPASAAAINAVQPLFVVREASAPLSSRACTVSAWPAAAAAMRAVLAPGSPGLGVLGSTPWARKSCTAGVSPAEAAANKPSSRPTPLAMYFRLGPRWQAVTPRASAGTKAVRTALDLTISLLPSRRKTVNARRAQIQQAATHRPPGRP